MRLSVLGCAGSFPAADSACSSYLVEADGFRLLLDFGNGAVGALQRHPAGLHGLDAILLTHLHCDHIVDACSYVVVRRYDPAGPFPPVPLYGPAGTAGRLAAVYGPDAAVHDVYDVRTLTCGEFPLGPLTVTVDLVNHPVETYGVRVAHAGRTLAYSADTGVSPALVGLARDVDLLLCEASYADDRPHPQDVHLTGREAGEHAAAAGAARLVLTHLVRAWADPEAVLAEARAAFSGPVELARPGAVYDLAPSGA